MQIIFFLIIVSLFAASGFLAAYFWAVRNGQFDDTQAPAWRMLFEEPPLTQKPSDEPHSATNNPSTT
jgi:cbb3-type cytochrome oxidase maturation protein